MEIERFVRVGGSESRCEPGALHGAPDRGSISALPRWERGCFKRRGAGVRRYVTEVNRAFD